MLSITFLVVQYFTLAVGNQQMTMIQGTITLKKNCLEAENTPYPLKCAYLCGKNDKCQGSYWVSNGSCFICDYGSFTQITRGITGNYAAIKRNFRNTQLSEDITTCPAKTMSVKTCENGWQLFPRYNNWWCLRVMSQENTKLSLPVLTQDQGSELCKSHEAIISGLETVQETRFVIDQVLLRMEEPKEKMPLPPFTSRPGWAVWIDGKRNKTCSGNVANLINGCDSMKGFPFTDPELYFKGGYDWAAREPNGAVTKQDCAQLMVPVISNNTSHGKLDDIQCNEIKGYLRKAVLCGKYAV